MSIMGPLLSWETYGADARTIACNPHGRHSYMAHAYLPSIIRRETIDLDRYEVQDGGIRVDLLTCSPTLSFHYLLFRDSLSMRKPLRRATLSCFVPLPADLTFSLALSLRCLRHWVMIGCQLLISACMHNPFSGS